MKAKVIEIKADGADKESIKKAICEAISETIAQEVEEKEKLVSNIDLFSLGVEAWPENRKKIIEAIKEMIEDGAPADVIAAFPFAEGFVEGYNTAIDDEAAEPEEECEENELN